MVRTKRCIRGSGCAILATGALVLASASGDGTTCAQAHSLERVRLGLAANAGNTNKQGPPTPAQQRHFTRKDPLYQRLQAIMNDRTLKANWAHPDHWTQEKRDKEKRFLLTRCKSGSYGSSGQSDAAGGGLNVNHRSSVPLDFNESSGSGSGGAEGEKENQPCSFDDQIMIGIIDKATKRERERLVTEQKEQEEKENDKKGDAPADHDRDGQKDRTSDNEGVVEDGSTSALTGEKSQL